MLEVFSRMALRSTPSRVSWFAYCRACPRWWTLRMNWVILRSSFSSGLSVSTKMRSKREMSAGGRSIWLEMVSLSMSNLPYLGLAAASREHLHWRVAVIPALAIEIFCDSIASWSEEVSCSVILSNSSMHASPLSANTKAPASRVYPSPPKSSLTAAAVSPAADADLPEEKIALGARLLM